MKPLKIKDQVEFELYDCIGIVLTSLDGKSFKCQIQKHQILTFNPASETIGTRGRAAPSFGYQKAQMVYQILIGNNKAWISHIELQAALLGEKLP